MNTEKVANYIVNWLTNYAESAGVKGFVVGVSGGIDSALTSTLCAKTGFPVLCVEMPIHQAESQVTRAQEHITQLEHKFFNVTSNRVNLTKAFDDFKKTVPDSDNEDKLKLTLANTRARLRMTTLYYLAGLYDSLVVGTGNKVEDFGVGFYTKYGDGGVDVSPIADLLKSEVYELAKFLEIPKSIQEAAPTDGLFGDSRTDEDQLGASYDELEWAMQQHITGKSSTDFSGRKQEVFDIYVKLNTANRHKMVAIPVCEIPNELT